MKFLTAKYSDVLPVLETYTSAPGGGGPSRINAFRYTKWSPAY
jgi:hypothetical protein